MLVYFPKGTSNALPTLGRTTAGLVFVFVWHIVLAVVLGNWFASEFPFREDHLLRFLGWEYHSPSDAIIKRSMIALFGFAAVSLITFVVWWLSRVRSNRSNSFRQFVHCWVWNAAIGTSAIPVFLFLSHWIIGAAVFALPFVAFFVCCGPATIASRVLPTAVRWRPACPECGHLIAYVAEPRCTECGEPYLSTRRYQRRWAIQRLPWERRRRSFFISYVQTVFWIVVRPDSAAWRLSIPDRMGRAWRRTVGHVVGAILGLSTLAYALDLSYTLLVSVNFKNERKTFVGADQFDGPYFLWHFQWLSAWAFAIVIFPLGIGILLALTVPGISKLARSGVVKWCLYSTTFPILLGFMLRFISEVTKFADVLGSYKAGLVHNLHEFTRKLEEFPNYFALAFNATFAIWWAVGVASQPSLRYRGWIIFLSALALYATAWRIVFGLFDLRGFGGLLR